jgi:preprotein translocase subunit SecE
MAVSARRSVRAEQQGGVLRFLRETFDELRKVVWPTPQELYRYTLVVVVTVLVIGAFIFAVDQGLHFLTTKFIYSGTSAQ